MKRQVIDANDERIRCVADLAEAAVTHLDRRVRLGEIGERDAAVIRDAWREVQRAALRARTLLADMQTTTPEPTAPPPTTH